MVIQHILTPFEKRCLARNRRIVRRRREGLDAAELARRFRLTPGSIYRILDPHGRATGENLGRLSRKLHQHAERSVPALTPLQKRRLARDRRVPGPTAPQAATTPRAAGEAPVIDGDTLEI